MAGTARRRRGNLNSGLAMIGITLIIGLVASTVYVDTRKMQAQEQAYIQREETLHRQISEEEDRTAALNERKKYVNSRRHIEEVARDKLGLLNPDEVLLKQKDD